MLGDYTKVAHKADTRHDADNQQTEPTSMSDDAHLPAKNSGNPIEPDTFLQPEATSSPSRSPKYKPVEKQEEVLVIGAGWYGAHIAKTLAERGYKVTLVDREKDIFCGTSGKFGVRIHVGPHYPRSHATRVSCRTGYHEFLNTYKSLINEHESSIYAVGLKDVDDKPSKVSQAEFKKVCEEFNYRGEISLADNGYNPNTVLAAFDVTEPSAVLGPQLREQFRTYLKTAGVAVECNTKITSIEQNAFNEFDVKFDGVNVKNVIGESKTFDHVINATGYQSFALPPEKMPFKVVYQVCIALAYRERVSSHQPMSIIFMDGWFPCLMPYDDRTEKKESFFKRKYILTHGKYTLLASYTNPQDAYNAMSAVDDAFINERVRAPCEESMKSFWDLFAKKFEFIGFEKTVLEKIQTESEFRGSVVFRDPQTKMIHVLPGKITNIFDAEREVFDLMRNRNLTLMGALEIVKLGVCDKAAAEFKKKIELPNTCNLNPFRHLLPQPEEKEPALAPKPNPSLSKLTEAQELEAAAIRRCPRAFNSMFYLLFLIHCRKFLTVDYQDKDTRELMYLKAGFIVAFWLYSQKRERPDSLMIMDNIFKKLGFFASNTKESSPINKEVVLTNT